MYDLWLIEFKLRTGDNMVILGTNLSFTDKNILFLSIVIKLYARTMFKTMKKSLIKTKYHNLRDRDSIILRWPLMFMSILFFITNSNAAYDVHIQHTVSWTWIKQYIKESVQLSKKHKRKSCIKMHKRKFISTWSAMQLRY